VAEAPDLRIGVQWRRSARARCVGLRIDVAMGGVIITLPPRTPRRFGLLLLAHHADWVAARLAALPPLVAFADGATIPFVGRRVTIRHMAGAERPAQLLGGELVVHGPKEHLACQVGRFLHAEAGLRLAALVAGKGVRAGERPRRLLLKELRSRWASCAVDRTLSFSWRLVMAPLFVQDHVVAHEVAHLRHMDHGPQFLALERELSRFPDHAKAWLKRHGPALLRVGRKEALPSLLSFPRIERS